MKKRQKSKAIESDVELYVRLFVHSVFLFIFFRSHLILIETLKMKLSLKNIFYEMLSTDRLVHYLARLRFDYHGNRTMFCFFLN